MTEGARSPGWQQRVPPVMVRVAGSLAVGALTYAVTASVERTAAANVILGVVIGGVVFVATCLAEFEHRLTSAVQDQRASLADLTTATRLEELLRASPLAVGDVFDLIENLTAIHSLGIAPISGLAVEEWERLLRFTRQLGVGETRYDGEDREWLLALTALAQGQIIATSSLPVDNGFWDSELGSRYLEMQEEAIARGVRVRRVFILAGARPEPDPTVERIRALQQEKRIEVRFLDIDVLTVGQRRLYKDYVLVDSRVYYQVQPPSRRWGDDESGSAVVETLLSVRAPEVEFARDYFEQLWKLAGGSSIP